MKHQVVKMLYCLGLAGIPALLYGFSTGPPIKRTGAPIDGGLDCTACHRTFAPANSDPRGTVTIDARTYNPGVTQTIRVIVHHPESSRWGFQLTARQVSDPSKPAGSFVESDSIRVRCDDGTNLGSAGPCNENQAQFASHTQPATSQGEGGQRVFEVQWNPPANEVGEIVFYAAGNAANFATGNQGDRIYTTQETIGGQGACTLTTRPTLRSVTNGASFATSPGISINSMLSIFGLNFQVPGRSRRALRGDYVDGKFPTELGCVAVEVAGRRVPITYVQNDQINVQAPTIQTMGPVEVRVILNPGQSSELRSDVATVPMTSHSPAFFKYAGSNSIAAQHAGTFATLANPSVVAGGAAASPGETIILYGTGFGLTEPVYQAGENIPVGALARLRDTPTITIGGITLAPADILYSGLTPGSISGLYQFNVKVPTSVAAGDVSVFIRIGGIQTPDATIPVVR